VVDYTEPLIVPGNVMSSAKIIWTKVDEAPALATCSLLPIVRAYARGTGVEFDTHDISLAGRIIATFPDRLREDQQIPDELTWLGALARTPVANIIKLPNISASIPQLQAAITELQAHGYDIPDYPVEEPKGDAEQALPRLRQRLHDRRVEDALPSGSSTGGQASVTIPQPNRALRYLEDPCRFTSRQ
jgi:isocitrate dehydrogenase